MKTSTLGTGQLIKNAIEEGCTNVILFIGGSATNDGGVGAACALGYKVADRSSQELRPTGENLRNICKIISPKQSLFGNTKIRVATDVTNPLIGTKGATYFFGPQKGATQQSL
jgi:glycerate kinase